MKFIILILIALLTGISTTLAQNDEANHRLGYFISADSDGVQQVYQILLDGQSEPRQITFATRDVLTFGASYDGLAIAYISDGQLWLQPIHTESAESLTTINATQFLSTPIFSQDGQYVAYADGGLWLLDLATRQTEQLAQDVPFDSELARTSDYLTIAPHQFVMGTDGAVTHLIVTIGQWEWVTAGVYDLATDELQVLEGQLHTQLLPLSNGQVLLYGNGGVAGEFALHIANSLADINTYTRLVDFSTLTDMTLFAMQAVEVAPGVVRILGETISQTPNEVNAFYFDYDVVSNTAGEVFPFLLYQGEMTGVTTMGAISPDGMVLPIYINAIYTDFGTLFGAVELFDFLTGIRQTIGDSVGIYRWQP